MKNISTISERVSQLIDSFNININQFAKNLGYERSQAIYDIANGKSKPSFDFFERLILSEYSEKVNLRWLITGSGSAESMLSEPNPTYNRDKPPGPCQQCDIRDMLIKSQEKTIEALQARLDDLAAAGQKRKVS